MPETPGAVDLGATGGRLQTGLDRIWAEASRFGDAVALFRALGGGWTVGVESLGSDP